MMIKQIFKMIWNQRRLNGWIWMELLVVFVALWYLVDMFVVQLYSYTRPMGYDITNCWKLSFDVYPEDADEYVNDTTRTQTEGEALAKILERLRRAPEVDNACVAFYSSPYSGGNSWTQIMPCTADSSKFKEQSYHQYIVSAEFYDVFRIKSREGKPLSELLTQKQLSYFITPALEKDFFGSQSAVGQKVRYPGSTREIHIAAVTAPVRITEFVKPEPELFFTMWPKELERQVNATGASNMEVTVRMKEELTSEQMGHFLNRMKNQLTENNLYITGMEDMKQQRSDRLQYEWRKISINLLLSVFIQCTFRYNGNILAAHRATALRDRPADGTRQYAPAGRVVLYCRGVAIAHHGGSVGIGCHIQYGTHGDSRFIQSLFHLVALCGQFWWGAAAYGTDHCTGHLVACPPGHEVAAGRSVAL